MPNNSPSASAGSMVIYKVTSDGRDLPDQVNLISIQVDHAVNKIASALLVFAAGNDSAMIDPAIIDSDEFSTGKLIEIFAGYEDGNLTGIFKGIVVRHELIIEADILPSFRIHCRHESVKMIFNERERSFEQLTDAGLIDRIIGEYGMACTTQPCTEINETVIQKSTDWNLIVSRSNSNGFIITQDGASGMRIGEPQVSGIAALTVELGNDLFSFIGTTDATFQPSGVIVSAWNAATANIISSTAAEPLINKQGDTNGKDLAASLAQSDLCFMMSGTSTTTALQKKADAILLRKRLSALKGEASFQGSALAVTGCIIEIKGVGKKLSGDAFITAVSHKIDSGNWTSNIKFGLDDHTMSFSNSVNFSNEGTGMLAGLQPAVVKQIASDPGGERRIMVEIPSASNTATTVWARMSQFYASRSGAAFFIPEIGDEVILGFLNNDPQYPVILGSLFSSRNETAEPEDSNDLKAFVSRNKLKLEFDEAKKSISMSTPGGNSVSINDEEKSILINDQNGNIVRLDAAGINMQSAKNIEINAGGDIIMKATGSIKAEAAQDLNLTGMNVNAKATVGFHATGTARAELAASGNTTIKGSMIMIN